MTGDSFDSQVGKLAALIVNSNKIVVFTGAGISTESGIPDFRSPGGIWSKYDPNLFTIQHFLNNDDARKLLWRVLSDDEFIPRNVEPNAAHNAVAELEELGRLDCVITQNVDYLHEEGGSNPDRVFHLHGTMGRAKCIKCETLYPMDEVRQWIEQGVDVPICKECNGLLKPDAVFFGENLPEYELSESQRRAQSCDLCIVIGSSLVVYPAALMPRYAVQSGAKLAIINRDRTDLDSYAEVCIHESAGQTMSRVMELVRKKL
ncbi:MAG: NAD-dependent deacylase [Chloroflexi bacterium]|nr:NAD-dependent deacylase [Chloroflexota bacterium]